MKAKYALEDNEHAIEIYLNSKEIARLYNEEGVVIKKEKNYLGDGKDAHFYVSSYFEVK